MFISREVRQYHWQESLETGPATGGPDPPYGTPHPERQPSDLLRNQAEMSGAGCLTIRPASATTVFCIGLVPTQHSNVVRQQDFDMGSKVFW